MKWFLNWIDAFMARLYPPTTMPPEASTSPVQPSSTSSAVSAPVEPVNTIPRIDIFCNAIKDYEGGPGDANYRNNNPGNCRYNPSGYLPKYGDVKCSPAGFAIFPTWEQGWEYLEALVQEMAADHPKWDFIDFFSVYAPTSDGNDVGNYAIFVATRCGVPPATLVSTYLHGDNAT